MTKQHLWQGEWLDDAALRERVPTLPAAIQKELARPVDLAETLMICDRFADDLKKGGVAHGKLSSYLCQDLGLPKAEATETLGEFAQFMARDNLALKVKRELGSLNPQTPMRVDYRTPAFEAWAPLGYLFHFAPSNAMTVPPLTAIEGLLAGNFNVVKLSRADSLFTQHFFAALAAHDPQGLIQRRVIVVRLSSQEKGLLGDLIREADGVAAWGGEEGIAGARELAPAGARVIEWGPKISFAYVTRPFAADQATLKALADEIVVVDQQACSSPQCVYLDTNDRDELNAFANRLAPYLAAASQAKALPPMDRQEHAEIRNVTEVARLESYLDLGRVIEAEDRSWRLLVDYRPALRTSPLYRSLWVKGLPRRDIVPMLRPMRQYLQTVGLACSQADLYGLARDFAVAGVDRVNELGKMMASYPGESHDGVYALQRYSRRTSLQWDPDRISVVSFDELKPPADTAPALAKVPIMTKQQFQSQAIGDDFAHLYFKSGGSSGEPKLSVFTYDDYHSQMFMAAAGLYAVGLRPVTDRCMNLFFGGGLYGGFVSFFTILEHMRAVQFPMGAHTDHDFVAKMIVQNRVNTLLGMPSYIIQLLVSQSAALKGYGGIRKIFYGGEHFNATQRRYFQAEFGIELIRSAVYGSVDGGPLGYQCEHSTGSVHHLFGQSQSLEIVKMDRDEPAAMGEVGRFLFTSRVRQGQNLTRYDIGDLGRWLSDPCPCGRSAPRFELTGRHGDVFRVGSAYLNYRKFCHILTEGWDYAGEAQIKLSHQGHQEMIELLVAHGLPAPTDEIRRQCLAQYHDLEEIVVQDRIVSFTVRKVTDVDFARTPGSGKLKPILDKGKVDMAPHHSLDELIAFVREKSPFYRRLYQTLGKAPGLADLPILDQMAFWQANRLQGNEVLTGPMEDGIIFKSGGTSGAPKFSVFTRAEWQAFTTAFGRGMGQFALRRGDRVANLFYVGELYASFLFIMKSMENATVPVTHIPLSGAADPYLIMSTITEFQANVLAGVPTTLLAFADLCQRQGKAFPGVERLIYGGESLYDDQVPRFNAVFPRAEILSIGYASVDAGLLGYVDKDCRNGEHRAFSPETLLEIVDAETLAPITEVGCPGKIILTNLTRKLMPIIRYPAGDMGVWVDEPRSQSPRFRILGRSEEGARIGPVTVYLEDLREIVRQIDTFGQVSQMQLVIRHHDGRDQLIIRLASHQQAELSPDWQQRLMASIYEARDFYKHSLAEGKIHPIAVEVVSLDALTVNRRTGKLVRLIDERQKVK